MAHGNAAADRLVLVVKIPVDHVIRPRLPWRSPDEPAITECGYDASKVKTLSREGFAERLKEYGRQRAGLVTCMTCMQAAERHPTWEEDPRLSIAREVQWEVSWWSSVHGSRENEGRHRLKDELEALAGLAAAFPDKFRELLAAIEARRQWIQRKQRNERAQ
jgi:hypothetical protein